MKKIFFTFLLFSFVASAQSPGEIISFEKKLDLTPEGIISFIAEKSKTETPSKLLEHLKTIKVGLIGYKLTYYTTDYNDSIVKATGLVMYPKSNKKLSTILYCHPTTDKRENVPSNLKDIIKVGFVLPLSYALNNYIVIAPDFYGMGDGDGTQNYGEAKTTASSILDMMTAGQTFLDQMNIERYDENFITGYSLGGHAGMAALRKATQDNSFTFKHAYLGAGPMDMSYSTLQKGVIDKKIFPISAFLANVVYTADKLEGNIRDESGEWSSVIREKYLDAFVKATVNDKGGILWGPVVWRNLFTDRVVNGITNDQHHPLRNYLKNNNVYDWYNTTPTTLMDGALDLIIHPHNNKVTLDTQRSYYPWWSLDKYKIKRVQTGPFSHITGILPWIFGSIHRFNSIRKGGYFNLRAERINSARATNSLASPNILVKRSSIQPDFSVNGNKQPITFEEISNVKQKRAYTKSKIKEFHTGIYLAKTNINGRTLKFPYVIEKPVELKSSDIFETVDSKTYLDLKDLQDEIKSIFIFNNRNIKIASIATEEYRKSNRFNIDNKFLKKGNTIELVTPNNIFVSKITQEELNKNQKYIINSVDEYATISSMSDNIESVEVFNVLGVSVHKQSSINNKKHTFKVKSGIYIIKIRNSNGEIFTKKVLL